MIKTLRHFLTLKFKSKRILASIYYTFFSRNFGREQKAVLAGKLAYEQSLKEIGETSVLLRRNIHKLEKGLIMQPRRDVFGEGVIGETVKIYEIAIKKGNLNTEEKKWFTDVLTKYFTVVKNTNTIMKVREKFEACVEQDNNSEKFIPYTFDTLPELSVNYEQLHKLFLNFFLIHKCRSFIFFSV